MLKLRLPSLLLLPLFLLLACGDDESKEQQGELTGSLYAIMYEVYDDVDSSSYLSLLDSLDVPEVDSSQAREYGGGRAFLQAYNGWVFVGAPSEPVVTRYNVSPKGELTDEVTIGFALYGLEAGNLDTWNATFISPTKAYLFDFVQGVTIIWNPTTMLIEGDIPAAPEFTREGLSFEGSPAMVRGNRLFRTFNWVNYDTAEYSEDSLLAVYDLDSNKLISLVEEKRCPAFGNLVHQDEAGNIYFSSWVWPLADTLLRGKAESCVLRIAPGSESFDAEWMLRYPEITGGKQGAMFTYLGDGKALFAAFHDEMVSFDAATDPWELAGSAVWEVWSVDLETRVGTPVPGLPLSSGAYTPARLDGRQLLMLPDTWAATRLYELKDGMGVPSIQVPGWTYQFFKVR